MTALEGRGREKGTVIWGPGYSDAEATARALAHTKTLKDGQCGYFTWVPIIKEKCGTMSSKRKTPTTCFGEAKNIGNYCAQQLQLNDNGSSDGSTIFVWVECDTRLPLPMDKQTSSIYKKPGVSRKRGGQYAYALDLGRQTGTASGCNAGPGAPGKYCTTIEGSAQADEAGKGACVSGEVGAGGASWSKVIGCPSLAACSGPERRSLGTNGAVATSSQEPTKCKDHAFGDHIAYPEEGGVLAIPGEWVEKWKHVIAAIPATNEARAAEFDKMGAL
ncbi:hypothetical protein N7533_003384 [Penicillium manginii]|uniref:uncharacterized protein n=1 Tax=Penicillium manginii TaxID=203109 RepID=UPI002546FA6D|nr:uncharacterized protein N7533_003384 [Penicillium manginii]KAJ5761345.1 hypothetical protein N7533_003384 [Penicillium manginii]